jgi:hypothetical protein
MMPGGTQQREALLAAQRAAQRPQRTAHTSPGMIGDTWVSGRVEVEIQRRLQAIQVLAAMGLEQHAVVHRLGFQPVEIQLTLTPQTFHRAADPGGPLGMPRLLILHATWVRDDMDEGRVRHGS